MNHKRLPAATSAEPADDLLPLAGELAAEFGRTAEVYRQHFGLSPDEARRQAADVTEEHLRQVLDGPPEEVGWYDLDLLARRDPALAVRRWEEVKGAARGEIRSGHRAGRALEGYDSDCWTRARFLALRAELTEALRPRTQLEQQLIDQLAGWQTQVWYWQEIAHAYAQLTTLGRRRPARKGERHESPRQSDADALEQATAMVERFHRLYLRTLEALRAGRKRPPALVRRACQVNVARLRVKVGN